MSTDKYFSKLGKEAQEDFKNIAERIKLGHTQHCACRQVLGDGECECGRNGTLTPKQRVKRIKKLIKLLRRS